MFFEQVRHYTASLGFFDEFAQKGRRRHALWLGANRLLHRGKLAVENSRAWQLFYIRAQARPQTRQSAGPGPDR